ncbi:MULTISPECIES: hypothetical protein [Sphingobacterium]|jgi:hypothetical protein|uniref:Uncharacterized protein n=1 Tax=Sphingobacterium multivorum TaxID=28454 RepID=A0A654DYP3_SPHMU|nr:MULTISPECIES: hypothetical protein [Sphingobacterium]QQT46424.1 hypothetical protein I6J00_07115 [Sphingobacterium multivorum]QQT61031.1 hypothetical protein I6I97_17675 [Sphingobacterium multivorum]SUI96896.1 Uncharacterised protein [Sphingobacterium multivorum]VXD07728.1 conserved hypothetical protein [Sphingobacterium multivorum]
MDLRKAVLSDALELVRLTEQLGYPADIEGMKIILERSITAAGVCCICGGH